MHELSWANLSRHTMETTKGSPADSNTKVIMSLLELVFWCIAFGLVALAIIIGNSLTIAVFTRKKLLRSRANYFLVSLASADLIVGVITVPMYMCILVSYWKYNSAMPSHFFFVYMAVDIFSGFASIFALTIIAIERLYAVLWPLKHRVASERVYHLLVTLAWVLSALISLFYFLNAYQVVIIKIFFYMIIFFIFSSLTIICIAYTLIWVRLRVKVNHDQSRERAHKPQHKNRPSESSSQSTRQSRNSYYDYEMEKEDVRRRVDHDILLTTLCIVTIVFVITWVPFYILNIVVFFRGGQMDLPGEAFYFSKLLHYSNSLINPIVYSIRIPRFSKTLSTFFKRRKQSFVKSYRLVSSRYTKSSSTSQSAKSREILEKETAL